MYGKIEKIFDESTTTTGILLSMVGVALLLVKFARGTSSMYLVVRHGPSRDTICWRLAQALKIRKEPSTVSLKSFILATHFRLFDGTAVR